MTIWTDLKALVEAEVIAQGYTGTLEELGINQPYEASLLQLLTLQAMLAAITATGGGGGSGDASAANQLEQITKAELTNTLITALSDQQIPSFINSPVNFGALNAETLKASAGEVYKLYCYNKGASLRFFQIHDKATTPINAEVPKESFPIAPNTALIIDSTFWGADGRSLSNGVSWAFSSTEATLTLASAAEQTSSVGYL